MYSVVFDRMWLMTYPFPENVPVAVLVGEVVYD